MQSMEGEKTIVLSPGEQWSEAERRSAFGEIEERMK